MFTPSHAVVGATDAAALVDLYSSLGFEVVRRTSIPGDVARALYGLDSGTHETVLAVPGASRGWLSVVETPRGAPQHGPCDLGPHAIDLYTTDIARSAALASAHGGPCGPIVRYQVGPLAIGEVKAVGTDHVTTVFIEVSRRRPSVLDRDPARLHSEIHSVVWTVASIDAVLPFWRDALGFSVLLDFKTREAAVAALMDLPRPDTQLRLIVLADASSEPMRVEFIEFPDDPGTQPPAWPLRGGLHAVCLEVDDVVAAKARLPEVAFGPIVTAAAGLSGAPARQVTGLAPGGVRLQLRERAA